MLKKYLTKFVVDILPSVAATVIGAYIVNHYIVTKPGADAPVAAAVSTAEPKSPEAAKADATADVKASETSDVVNIPGAGVRAKGISEKAVLERSTPEKPVEKSADKPAETASIAPEPRRGPSAPREKAVAKIAPVQPAAPAVVPVVVAPNPVPPAEAASTSEEHRDANDLARAAIERLRGTGEASPRPQEAARIPETPRVVSAPPVRPLPPPIMVSTPANESFDQNVPQAKPPYAANVRIDDPRRPTPPADIPSRPLDLHAEAAEPAARERTTVAEDMLSAAKSVFHAVLPK